MMRRLKPRGSIDKVPRNPRSNRNAIIRWTYLIGTAGLAVWLANFFLGGFFFLRGEGLVLGEPAVVAAEFAVTVHDLRVREGERVEAGAVAAVVSSQAVAETLARLTADLGARQNRLSELRIRAQTIESILDLAESRERIATDARKELERLMERGLLSVDKRLTAIDSEFRSRQDLQTLRAERRVVGAELEILQAAFLEAEAAARNLRDLYNDGQLRIPVDGIVSRRAVERGAVVRAGEPIVEVHGHQRYILAYLPAGGLYSIAPGDEVQISLGLRSVLGYVSRIEPYAAALPREFQRNFQPVERQQVVRVEFAPGETVPPLFSKVQLRSANLVPLWVSSAWTRARDWVTQSETPPLASAELRRTLP